MLFELRNGMPVLLTLTTVALALVYLEGWWRLRSGLPDAVSGWRLAAFIGGFVSLLAATGSPLDALEHRFLTAHMARHLLIMTAAAPLILVGAPVITLLHGLPQVFFRRVLAPTLRWPLARGFGLVVAHPVFCWLAGTTAVIAWHIPALFELGMRSAGWHEIEDVCFFTSGLLFWWPVVRPWPSAASGTQWSVPVYLFLATIPCDALSAFLTFCDRIVYPHYVSTHWSLTISSLADQERAGALMWVWVTFIYMAPAAVTTMRLLSPQVSAVDREVV
jgi:putative membrane protein